MSKKTKTYRGQRNYKNSLHNGCGCFYCTGNSKQDLQLKKQSIIDKEINDILKYKNKNTIMKNNFWIICPNCDIDIDLHDEDNFKDELLDDTDTTEIECFNCKKYFKVITNAIYSFSTELEDE